VSCCAVIPAGVSSRTACSTRGSAVVFSTLTSKKHRVPGAAAAAAAADTPLGSCCWSLLPLLLLVLLLLLLLRCCTCGKQRMRVRTDNGLAEKSLKNCTWYLRSPM
jgi:hypothetical protein